ncbi:MAG: hypothetical protein SOR95_08390 [Sutterella sp.]|nr:hypothetical protein [Sutterella sp.]
MMARENTTETKATKKKKATNTAKTQVLEADVSTMEEVEPVQVETSDMTYLAVSLPFDVEFTDIPNGNGGTKTIVLPGINSALRGKKTGVLALPGNAIGVSISKKDWEALKAVHGRELAFVGRNGLPPCITEVGDKAGFRSAQNEIIKDVSTGLEPIDPKALDVKEANEKE